MLFENIVLGALFFFLVPGILVSLPRGGSKFTVAFVHAVVFVLAYMVLQYLANYGGYDYAVYEGYEGYGDEDEYEDEYEDEEGFQMKKPVKKTGGIISPEEQLRKETLREETIREKILRREQLIKEKLREQALRREFSAAFSACQQSRRKGVSKKMIDKYCNRADELKNAVNELEGRKELKVKEGFYIFGNFFRRWFR